MLTDLCNIHPRAHGHWARPETCKSQQCLTWSAQALCSPAGHWETLQIPTQRQSWCYQNLEPISSNLVFHPPYLSSIKNIQFGSSHGRSLGHVLGFNHERSPLETQFSSISSTWLLNFINKTIICSLRYRDFFASFSLDVKYPGAVVVFCKSQANPAGADWTFTQPHPPAMQPQPYGYLVIPFQILCAIIVSYDQQNHSSYTELRYIEQILDSHSGSFQAAKKNAGQ